MQPNSHITPEAYLKLDAAGMAGGVVVVLIDEAGEVVATAKLALDGDAEAQGELQAMLVIAGLEVMADKELRGVGSSTRLFRAVKPYELAAIQNVRGPSRAPLL